MEIPRRVMDVEGRRGRVGGGAAFVHVERQTVPLCVNVGGVLLDAPQDGIPQLFLGLAFLLRGRRRVGGPLFAGALPSAGTLVRASAFGHRVVLALVVAPCAIVTYGPRRVATDLASAAIVLTSACQLNDSSCDSAYH